MEQNTFIEASCILNIDTRENFFAAATLKVCESFRFEQVKKYEV